MTDALRAELAKLRPDEKIDLGRELLMEGEREAEALPLQDWQKQALEAAVEEHRRHPDSGRPWEEVKADLLAKLKRQREAA